jgi:glycosyltransferase involved in cell wall biosynthesis
MVKPIVVDTEKVRQAPILPSADLHVKYPQFQKIVLMASRLEKEKNVILAVRAWAEVLKKLSQLNSNAGLNAGLKIGLIIVGSGSQENMLKAEASRRGLSGSSECGPSVIFEPWASQATLFSYYKSCDQFLVTSLFEGYGMALVEAQAAGAKIISTDVGVAREVGATIVDWNPEGVAKGLIGALA